MPYDGAGGGFRPGHRDPLRQTGRRPGRRHPRRGGSRRGRADHPGEHRRQRRAAARQGHRPPPIDRHPGADRRPHPHHLLVGPQAGNQPVAAARLAGRRRDRVPRTGKCPPRPGDGRHHHPGPGVVGVHRPRDARAHQARRHGRPADVRRRLWPPHQQLAAAPRRGGARPGSGRWCGRGPARGAPADRGRRGLDQDVRLHRQRSGRHRLPDLHVRGDEGRRRRRPPGGQTDFDPLVRPRWRPRCGARRRELGGARHRHGRRHDRRDGEARHSLRAHGRS
jgi:hypothetical protein